LKLCANGTPGYEGGEMYAVRNPCKNLPLTGHIFCDSCRREASGGLAIPQRLPHDLSAKA
jgi:hypothetical protein